MYKLRGHNIDIAVVGNELKINVPEGFSETSVIDEVRMNKEQLITYINDRKRQREVTDRITKTIPRPYYRLTPPQQRLFLLHELSKEAVGYNLPQAYSIQGNLDIVQLNNAFLQLINRHESLRTAFEVIDHEPVQKVLDTFNFEIEQYKSNAGEIQEIINGFIRPFDLGKAPLIRAALVELEKELYVLLVDIHHIVSDATSQQVLMRDFVSLYNNQELAPLNLQYKDYVDWYYTAGMQDAILRQKGFWLKEYNEPVPVLDLPIDFIRPKEKNYQGDVLHFTLNQNDTLKLQQLARQENSSLYMVLLSAFSILLSRLGNQDEVVIGTPVAGRKSVDLEGMIGMFINTLPLHLQPASGLSFKEYLSRVNLKTLSCFDHQDYPYEKLIDELKLSRDPGRNPLFDVLFAFQNVQKEQVNTGKLNISSFEQKQKTSKFDLSLIVEENAGGLDFFFEYATGLFKAATIERFAHYFQNIIQAVIQNAAVLLEDIKLVHDTERQFLLNINNHLSVRYPDAATLVDLFEQQVAATPDKTAIVFGEQAFTYIELNNRANQLAYLLRDKGVARDTIVGLLMDKSALTVIGMLGIIKAGGAYLPVDVEYPQERIDYMLQDSRLQLLVTCSEWKSLVAGNQACVLLDELSPTNDNIPNPAHINKPEDLCYIIYTSGTTGKPKGVMVEHKNVVRLLFNDAFQLDFSGNDVWTMFHSHCFDVSVWEMYGALLRGGKLVIVPRMDAMDPGKYLHILKKHQVSVLCQTPTAFYNLINVDADGGPVLPYLRYVIFAGEALYPLKLRTWYLRYPFVKLVNMFGTTETTVHATYKEIGDYEIDNNLSYVGRPIPTLSIYLFDRQLEPVPQGVTGELYIGGEGVSRGYLYKEALTAERFIRNPFNKNERLYRTGDLARMLPDGEIEYLGRADQQVQLRGFRIEPGEIEYHLLQHELVDNAVVVARTAEGSGEKYLCAYIVARAAIVIEDLRAFLGRKLPAYMVPSYFMQIDSIPVTANNKINVGKLPVPVISTAAAYIAPISEEEKILAEIWAGVLAVDRVGVKDNFFSLGGDSLKAISLVYTSNKKLNTHLSIADLYANQTIEELSAFISRSNASNNTSLPHAIKKIRSFQEAYLHSMPFTENYEEIYPMNGVEKGMVFHSLKKQQDEKNIHKIIYHEQNIYPINYKNFDFAIFAKALQLLVNKHATFRKIYDLDKFAHIVQKQIEPRLSYVDISHLSTEEQETFMRNKTQEEKIKATNLSFSLLWRMCIIKLKEDFHFLLFDMHHSVMDGWSLSSFITELNNTYFQLQKNPGYMPQKLQCDYRDQIAAELAAAENEESIAYWKNELQGYTRLQLPRTGLDHQYKSDFLELGQEWRKSLEELAAAHRTSFKHLCFAAYLYTMNMLVYTNDLVVGIVTNNRPLVPDGENLLGCFLNTVPFRLVIPEELTWAGFIELVEEKLRLLKKHEQVSFRDILDIIQEPAHDENPVFDTAFNYVDFRVFNDMLIPDNMQSAQNIDFSLGNYVNNNTLLDLHVFAHNQGFRVGLTYSTIIVDEALSDKIRSYYKNVLHQFVYNTYGAVRNEQLLTAGEKQRLLHQFNDTAVPYHSPRCILPLFEAQVQHNPGNIAVEWADGQMSYAVLNEKANRLARYLQYMGVRRQDVIGTLLPRSADMMICIYALLKLGAVYMPLDPANPVKRNEYILSNAGCKFVLTSAEEYRNFELNCEPVNIEDESIGEYESNNLDNQPDEHDVAYIIYTSGSTGQPKGVPIRHYSLYNRLVWMQAKYPLQQSDKILHKTRATFDVSVWEIFWWGITGASVHLLPAGEERDAYKIISCIEKNNVTIMHFVPSALSFFLQAVDKDSMQLQSLRRVFASGEALTASQVEEFRRKLYLTNHIDLVNLYGPTEAAIDVTYYDCFEYPPAERVPIGKPISNTQLYVVDKNNQLLPEGIAGELCIAGDGIFNGYVQNKALTEKVLVNNLFNQGQKMYKTGDLCYWMPDGNVQYVGRIDNQVKIRGFRIELEEIEQQLQLIPHVVKAIVVAFNKRVRTRADDHLMDIAELVAAVICEEDKSFVQSYFYQEQLRAVLPEYMIPSRFVHMTKAELTQHDKFDRKALREYLSNFEYITPDVGREPDEKEMVVLKIWKEILNIEHIGVNDVFFDIGGHSLHAVQLMSRFEKELGIHLEFDDIMYLSLAQMASKYIDQ